MKEIQFSKEQYLRLLKLVYIGNWVINAHGNLHEQSEDYANLESFLFSKVKDFGLDHLAFVESDFICPSTEFEEDRELRTYIEQYDHKTFWEELCGRFAMKKFIETHGEKAQETMDRDTYAATIIDFENHYRQIFQNRSQEDLDFTKL